MSKKNDMNKKIEHKEQLLAEDSNVKLYGYPLIITRVKTRSREAELLSLLKEADKELREFESYFEDSQVYLSNPDKIKLYKMRKNEISAIRKKISKAE